MLDVEIPEDLKTNEPEIREWFEYKVQRGQRYKPKGLDAFFRVIRKIPPEQRRISVETSMANNWAGIFPVRNNRDMGGVGLPSHEQEAVDEIRRRKGERDR
jgi:hypothetical protein